MVKQERNLFIPTIESLDPTDSSARGCIEYLQVDVPGAGLPQASDIRKLLAIMNRLVDSGNTVIVIEHNLDIIKNADWIIDLGPEGGNKGGRVIFEGTPVQLLRAQYSYTGEYLRSESAVLLEQQPEKTIRKRVYPRIEFIQEH